MENGKDTLGNLQFIRRYIKGRYVLLLDECAYDRGELQATATKDDTTGALSVTGVFLGKTV